MNGILLSGLTTDVVKTSRIALAVFPTRSLWLEVVMPGTGSLGPVVDRVTGLLHTLRPAINLGREESPHRIAGAGSFVGHWFVHDSQLDIASETSAIISSSSPCVGSSSDACVERDHLTLSSGSNAEEMRAVVTGVTVQDLTTNQSYSVGSGQVLAVGDRLQFEFVEPHLLMSTLISAVSPTSQQAFGDPYWCGTGLAPKWFGLMCGAWAL